MFAIAAGFLLTGALAALAGAASDEPPATVSEANQIRKVTGVAQKLTVIHQHHILKQGNAPGGVLPQYITGQGYTPSQIMEAYGFSGLQADGTGQKIAIVVAFGSPTLNDDVAEFCTAFNLPPPANFLHVYTPYGQPGGYDENWAFESSLDVEWVHALAPGATIDLVVSPTNLLSDLLNAVEYATQTLNAQVVGMSWGTPEFAGEGLYDSVFKNTGTVFVAASGDTGSGTFYPAASPNVVAVGGTTLYLQPGTGTLKFPEVAWEGSGGGSCAMEPKPAYQITFGVPFYPRSIPDIAFLGDPSTGALVYDSNADPTTHGWWIAGGTSLSAQCWVAIIALADQLRTAAFLTPLTDGHQALYTLAGYNVKYNVKGCYRDITWGYNGNYAAAKAFDLITGLGSPMVNILVPALATIKQ
jgi:subtilase family serine protease